MNKPVEFGGKGKKIMRSGIAVPLVFNIFKSCERCWGGWVAATSFTKETCSVTEMRKMKLTEKVKQFYWDGKKRWRYLKWKQKKKKRCEEKLKFCCGWEEEARRCHVELRHTTIRRRSSLSVRLFCFPSSHSIYLFPFRRKLKLN